MMKKTALLFLVLVSVIVYGQHPPASYFHLVSIADSLSRAFEYKSAAAHYNAAFTSFKKKGLVNDRYKAACAYARIGNADSAYYNLFRIANKAGWSEYDFLISDADLLSLHSDPRWNNLVNKVRKNKAEVESHLNQPLAYELNRIFEDDQKYRLLRDSAEKVAGPGSPQLDSLYKLIEYQDARNLKRVKELLDKYGWLGADDVGRKGNQAIFFVIQHADVVTRKKYLPMMREAAGRGKAVPVELAQLEDRILVDEKLGQKYGTQVVFRDETKTYELYPIAEESGVNERREDIGLQPLEDYLRQFGIHYAPKNAK